MAPEREVQHRLVPCALPVALERRVVDFARFINHETRLEQQCRSYTEKLRDHDQTFRTEEGRENGATFVRGKWVQHIFARLVCGAHKNAGRLERDLRHGLKAWIATCLVGTSSVSSMILDTLSRL